MKEQKMINPECQEIQQPDSKTLRKVYRQRKIAKWCAPIVATLTIATSSVCVGVHQDTKVAKSIISTEEQVKSDSSASSDAVIKSDAVVQSDAVANVTSEPKQKKTIFVEQPKPVKQYSPPEIVVSSDSQVSETTSLGQFKISAYCHCSQCCGKSDGITATGTIVQPNRTIAVDPNVIPLGSSVIIDGQTYVAEDTGGAIKGNRIDMYFATHQEALNFGIQYKNVSLINIA